AAGDVSDRAGPAEVPQAALRGAGQDDGRQGAGRGDLQDGPSDVPPGERRDGRRDPGVEGEVGAGGTVWYRGHGSRRSAMSFLGHVRNGGVVFDEPVALPEGTPVRVD